MRITISTSRVDPAWINCRRMPMLFLPTIGAAIAALLAYGRLRCRDQTATRRYYQTIAPTNNRIHPAHSRHHLPRRHLPDAIRPFYDCRAINNFTQCPALNSRRSCLRRGSAPRCACRFFACARQWSGAYGRCGSGGDVWLLRCFCGRVPSDLADDRIV